MALNKSFEQLEDRVLLASNVEVTFTGGVVDIIGENQFDGSGIEDTDNDIEVFTRIRANGDTELVVRGTGDSEVNGGQEFVINDAGGTITTINVELGEGDDTLDLHNVTDLDGLTAVTISGGYGSDVISIADLNQGTATVNLTIAMTADEIADEGDDAPVGDNETDAEREAEQDGEDVISIGSRRDVTNVNSITIEDEFEGTQVYITEAEVATAIDVTLAGEEVTTDDESVVFMSDVIVETGDVTITLDDSDDQVLLVDLNMAAATTLTVEADGGDDNVEVHHSTLGTLDVDDGEGTDAVNVYRSDVDTVTLTVGNGGNGGLGSEQRFGIYDTTIETALTLTVTDEANAGDNVFASDMLRLTGGAAAFTFGDGDDVVFQINTTAQSGVTLDYTMGEGDDRVGLNNANFRGSVVTYDGEEGDDQLSIGNNSDVQTVTATDAEGENGFFLTNSLVRDGLTLNAAGSTSNMFYTAGLRVIDGNVTITGGNQDDTVMILDDSYFRVDNFTVLTGNSGDDVIFNDAYFRVGGDFDVRLGDGDDTVTANGTEFQVAGLFAFRAGIAADDDTATGTGNTSNQEPDIIENFDEFDIDFDDLE